MSTNQNTRRFTFSVRGCDGSTKEFCIGGWFSMSVLEALLEAYRRQDPDLGFRFSCTIGRCHSCLLKMNGRAVVSCREPMIDGAALEPMPHRRIFRDLATDDSSTRGIRGSD